METTPTANKGAVSRPPARLLQAPAPDTQLGQAERGDRATLNGTIVLCTQSPGRLLKEQRHLVCTRLIISRAHGALGVSKVSSRDVMGLQSRGPGAMLSGETGALGSRLLCLGGWLLPPQTPSPAFPQLPREKSGKTHMRVGARPAAYGRRSRSETSLSP